MGANEFFGPIPASISNASQLQILEISTNNLVGQVPASLGYLGNLRRLTLSTNNLGSNSSNDLGYITSLTNCSKLEILDIGYNNFGGVLPNSVANLSTQMTNLYLGGNQVSGIIPEPLENLHNLIILSMENN
jgi:Leucine-rich repeat (LRR) protein